MSSERTERLVERLLDDAELAREAGDWSAVVSLTDDVVALDADNAEAKALRSMADRKLQELTETSQANGFAKRRRMTVLFCDIVGSTAIAETRDPEEVRDILLAYQDACHQAMKRYDGYVAKYLGDGLMVFFGFPKAHEDDARRAVHAALATIEALDDLAPTIERDYGIELKVRIGVHTGLVVITQMGSSQDVVGSTVNQTDRIQHRAAPGSVVISEATAELVSGYFDLESMGPVSLPGLEQPVELFTVTGATGAEERLEAAGTVVTPFVGRDHERRRLAELWDVTRTTELADHTGRTVLLRGGPGLGKSRLGAWLRDLSNRTGGAPLWGTTSPYYGSTPFHALVRMMRRRIGIEGETDDGSHLARLEVELDQAGLELGGVVPLLAPMLDIQLGDAYTTPQLEPLELRQRTIAAFRSWFHGLAAKEPLVIAIEDVHWAEPSTLELLSQTIIEGPPPGSLLLLTARPEFSADWEQLPAVTVIEVEPLDKGRRVEFIQAMSGSDALDPNAVTDISERSDGIPLFIEELVRHTTSEAIGAIPDTLQELLLARLEATSSGDLKLAQVAATIGRRVDIGLTARVMGADEQAIRSGLDSLAAGGMMEAHGFGNHTRYAFRHALIRDIAYESQLMAEARTVHSGVADALIADSAAGAPALHALVALHLDRADRHAEAVGFYYLAGQASQASGAYSESVAELGRGLELIENIPEGEARVLMELGVRTYLALAITFTQGYGAAEAYEHYRRALDLSETLGDRPEGLGVQLAIHAYATIRGLRADADEITENIQARLAEAEPAEAAYFDAEIIAVTGLHEWMLGHYTKAQHDFEGALEIFERRPEDAKVWAAWPIPNDPIVASYAQLIPLRWTLGDFRGAMEAGERALQRCTELGFPKGPFSEAYTHGYLGYVYQIAGRYAEAADEFAAMLTVSNDHGFAMWQGFANAQAIMAAAALAPSPELLGGLSGVRQLFGGLGVQSFQPYFLSAEAELTQVLGDAKAAIDLFDLAADQAERHQEVHYQAETLRKRAGARLAANPEALEGAVADLLGATSLARDQEATIFRLRAEIDIVTLLPESVRPPTALTDLATTVEMLGDNPDYPEIAAAQELLA